MITTSFESQIGKETHYLKMEEGDENIWRTLYTTKQARDLKILEGNAGVALLLP